MYVCVTCVCGCPWRPEEDVISPRTGVQAVVSCPTWVPRTELQLPTRVVEPSLQPGPPPLTETCCANYLQLAVHSHFHLVLPVF